MQDIFSKVYIPNKHTSVTLDPYMKPNNRYLGDQKVLKIEKEAELDRKTINLHHLYSKARSGEEKAEPKEEFDSDMIKY